MTKDTRSNLDFLILATYTQHKYLEGVTMNNKNLLIKCAEETLEMVKRGKTEMCRNTKGKEDVPPFICFGVEVEDEDGNARIGGAMAEIERQRKGQHPVDALPSTLSKLHKDLMEADTQFIWLMMVTEGYSRRNVNLDDLTEEEKFPDRGVLEKEFLTKADTNVVEGIVGLLFAQTNEAVMSNCFYKYDDKCLPIYEENEVMYLDGTDHENYPAGQIAKVMTTFMKYDQACQLISHTRKSVEASADTNPFLSDLSMVETRFPKKSIPDFLTVWKVVTDEGLPKDKAKKKKMKKKVEEFLAQAFFLRVTYEMWGAIKEKAEAGELDLEAFMSEMKEVMTGDDDKRKTDFMSEMMDKYSISVASMMLATGMKDIPDDPSGLMK